MKTDTIFEHVILSGKIVTLVFLLFGILPALAINAMPRNKRICFRKAAKNYRTARNICRKEHHGTEHIELRRACIKKARVAFKAEREICRSLKRQVKTPGKS